VLEATAWGALGASSLLIGALLGTAGWISRLAVGLILGFGAGALISAVSFELTEEAFKLGGADATAAGLALGALAFFAGDTALHSRGAANRQQVRDEEQASGTALLLGAVLDGVPESAVIGITLLAGGEVSVAMLAAVFISNLPEGIGGASGMRATGRSTRSILGAWTTVAVVCALSAGIGYGALDGASGELVALLQAFAAGGVLTMLADTMIPDAYRQGGRVTGLLTVLGFALAALLSASG
jgi:zinc transporter, ZIP family